VTVKITQWRWMMFSSREGLRNGEGINGFPFFCPYGLNILCCTLCIPVKLMDGTM